MGKMKDIWLWLLLVIGGRNIKLAKSWNELSDKQLGEIAAAMEQFRLLKKTTPEASLPSIFSRLYIALVKNLLRPNNMIKTWVALQQLPPEEYQKHVKFILDGISRTKFPAAFKLKRIRMYPPADRLGNLSINEFSFADSLFYNWDKTGDDRYLDLLCATLYRSGIGANTEYDIRKPYVKNVVERDVVLFSRLSKKKKLAIAYTYRGSRNYIAKLYPHVFPQPPKLSEEEKQEAAKRPEPKYTPFGQLIQYKIQFDPSRLVQTQNLNIHDFLSIYENELKEMKHQKK